jgi:predicted dehydrogenase
MRLGIIGCGQVVEVGHVPALLVSPKIETVAVADISERRARIVADALSERGRPRVYADHRRMLEVEDLALVLVATPPGVRLRPALDVAASGRHLLCEKPIATTLVAADAIVRASDAHGVRCLMVHNYASFEEYRRMRELVRNGVVGHLQTVILEGLGSYPWDGVHEYRPGWRYTPSLAGGGRLMDTGVHNLYLAEMLFGKRPTDVSADAYFDPGGPPTDIRCFARYRFDSGLALVHIGEGQGGCRVEVIGERGRIQLQYPEQARGFDWSPLSLKLHRDGVLFGSEPIARRRQQVTGAFYDDVLARLIGPAEYFHSGRHGRDLLATVMATYRAIQMAERIDVQRSCSLPLDDVRGSAVALTPSPTDLLEP